MNDWTSGYVANIAYTYGYYTELNPLRTHLAFLNQGLVCPKVGTACELGFGQGLSANIHAAASGVQWWGTDFNPSQAAFAHELAAASGARAQWSDASFEEFFQRPDLPDFDYIGLHGIWSWISPENRSRIVEFIRRKLKVGGVLYISYNTLPGWSAFAPVRHLMNLHAENIGGAAQGMVSKVEAALAFAENVLAQNPLMAKANPLVAERFKRVKEQNRHYLAHEYFNRDWHPMYFADMAQYLQEAKLQFACSAHYLDHIDGIQLTTEQQTLLKGLPDSNLRESVRDYMVNQQFRRDYWVKGVRRLSPLEQSERLRALRVVLVSPAHTVSLKVAGALGEGDMNAEVYQPLLQRMADHRTFSLRQLEQALAPQGITFAQLVQAVVVLSGAGHVAAVQDDDTIVQAKPHTQRLNACLRDKARSSTELGYLASPVTGGAMALNRFQQLFLSSLEQGATSPTEWAQHAWLCLSQQGQKLVKDGQPLATDAENLAELGVQAQEFAQHTLPIVRALEIL